MQDPTFRWSVKVDRISFLDSFEDEDWDGVEEVVIDITRDHPALLREKLAGLGDRTQTIATLGLYYTYLGHDLFGAGKIPR